MVSPGLAALTCYRPELRAGIAAGSPSVPRHMLEAGADANIPNTRTITNIVCNLIDPGAIETEPFIDELWQRDPIEQSLRGDLEATRECLRDEPRSPPYPPMDIFELYRSYAADIPAYHGGDEEDGEAGFPGTASGHASMTCPPLPVRRRVCNDPRPCGNSGKYKKCYMK